MSTAQISCFLNNFRSTFLFKFKNSFDWSIKNKQTTILLLKKATSRRVSDEHLKLKPNLHSPNFLGVLQILCGEWKQCLADQARDEEEVVMSTGGQT